MNEIDKWLARVKEQAVDNEWDDKKNTELLNVAPAVIFDTVISENQHEAIAYWLEICQRLEQFHHYNGDCELVFRYKQFCYCKVQALAIAAEQDEAIKRWAIKKLDLMLVSMLDYCQQQTSQTWLDESHRLINDHILFMQSLGNQNLSLGSVIRIPH